MSLAENLHAVILAGGSGTRLWPLSTRQKPKQFLSVGGGDSLIRQTWVRIAAWLDARRGWVVCGRDHASLVREHLPEFPAAQILAEPEAKNTAAAIALAALCLSARDPEAVMAVLPADHFIPPSDWAKYSEDLRLASELAVKEQALVTLGIRPTEAATGYGYIERGEAAGSGGFRVKAFHEKPDAKTASHYLGSPSFFWNSGMFVWRAATFLEELKRGLPETHRAIESLRGHLGSAGFERRAAEVFARLENISVDYGVLERSERVAMIPARFAWDDVGALTSLKAMAGGDARDNFFQGAVYPIDASGNMVISHSKPIALLGVMDLMVIEGEKAILILPKQRAQEVRDVVRVLKDAGRDDLL